VTQAHRDTAKVDGASANPLPNGYYKLQPGKLANACTYLEMTRPPTTAAHPTPSGVGLERLRASDAVRFQQLFRVIAGAWLWGGHLTKSAEQIAALLESPDCEIYVAADPLGDIGLLQLGFDGKDGIEVEYFGLVERAIGKGVGHWLMQEAIALAFAKPIRRLWLHTCTFDHPGALRFYQLAGFKIYATGFEIMDDPRANGLLPDTAAPHVPMAR
jgi:GNAT superfamily N-acetyltransferase